MTRVEHTGAGAGAARTVRAPRPWRRLALGLLLALATLISLVGVGGSPLGHARVVDSYDDGLKQGLGFDHPQGMYPCMYPCPGAAGIFQMRDNNTGDQTFTYCIQMNAPLQDAQSFTSGGYDNRQQILWLIANHGGGTGNNQYDQNLINQAALQYAMWHYTDGFNPGNANPAQTLAASWISAADGAVRGGWRRMGAQGSQFAGSASPGPDVTYATSSTVNVHDVDLNGTSRGGDTVWFNITSQGGTGASFSPNANVTTIPVRTNGAGNATATIYYNRNAGVFANPGSANVTVTASADRNVYWDPGYDLFQAGQNQIMDTYSRNYSMSWNQTYTIRVTASPIERFDESVNNMRTGAWTWGASPPGAGVPASPGDTLRYDMFYKDLGAGSVPNGSIVTDMTGVWGSMQYLANPRSHNGSPLNWALWQNPCFGDTMVGMATWCTLPIPPYSKPYYKGIDGSAPVTADFDNGSNVLPICNDPYWKGPNWGIHGGSQSNNPMPDPHNLACADVTYTPGMSTSKTVSYPPNVGNGSQASPLLMDPNNPITLTYNVGVASTGDRNLPRLTLTDDLRNGDIQHLQNIKAPGANPATCFNGTACPLVWTIGDLPSGQNRSYTFTADIPPAPPNQNLGWIQPGQSVDLQNTVVGQSYVTNSSSSSTDTWVIDPCPPLFPSITIDNVAPRSFVAGSSMTYTVLIQNTSAVPIIGRTSFQSPVVTGQPSDTPIITALTAPAGWRLDPIVPGGIGFTQVNYITTAIPAGGTATYLVTVAVPRTVTLPTPPNPPQATAQATVVANDAMWPLCVSPVPGPPATRTTPIVNSGGPQ